MKHSLHYSTSVVAYLKLKSQNNLSLLIYNSNTSCQRTWIILFKFLYSLLYKNTFDLDQRMRKYKKTSSINK